MRDFLVKTFSCISITSCISTLIASPTLAVNLDIGGTIYDVITIEGTFNELEETLINQPWYSQIELDEISMLSDNVGDQFGFPNDNSEFVILVPELVSPFIVANFGSPEIFPSFFSPFFNAGVVAGSFTSSSREMNYTFIIQNENVSTPEPKAIIGLISIGLCGLLSKRQRN